MDERTVKLPARPKQQGMTPLLTLHIASLLKNNSRRMFPNDGESYCLGWELPRSLSPEVAEQLPALIAEHERHLQPAPFEEIVTRLAQLSLHFWHPDRPKGHTQALVRDYAEDLAEYPADILEEGIRQYRRRGKWFPKIAELREIMEPMLEARRNDLRRLQKLIEIKVREPDLLPNAEPKDRGAREVAL